MAACGSLHHIFENPRPDKTPQALLESLSPWNQLKPTTPSTFTDETASFSELFGEIHFKETLASNENHEKSNQTYASSCSDSLQLCTEGLGFESSYVMESSRNDTWQEKKGEESWCMERWKREKRKKERGGGDYPPPITSIGKNGRPWVCFKAHREEGRFVLEEVRIPTREFLESSRENGRLRMKLIQPEDDDYDEDGDDGDDDDDDCEDDDDGGGEGKMAELESFEDGEDGKGKEKVE